METTACSLALLLVSCAPGTTPDAETDPGDPCSIPLDVTLSSVSISGTPTTAAIEASVSNDSTSSTRLLGYILECRTLSPSATMLRGTSTSTDSIPPSSTLPVSTTIDPGVLDWSNSPSPANLRCILEVLYEYTGCDSTPPQARDALEDPAALSVSPP